MDRLIVDVIRVGRKNHRSVDLISDTLPFGRTPYVAQNRARIVFDWRTASAPSPMPSMIAARFMARGKQRDPEREKPIHLTGAECRPAQKLETGWLLAQALRSQTVSVCQLVRARERRRPPNQPERTR